MDRGRPRLLWGEGSLATGEVPGFAPSSLGPFLGGTSLTGVSSKSVELARCGCDSEFSPITASSPCSSLELVFDTLVALEAVSRDQKAHVDPALGGGDAIGSAGASCITTSSSSCCRVFFWVSGSRWTALGAGCFAGATGLPQNPNHEPAGTVSSTSCAAPCGAVSTVAGASILSGDSVFASSGGWGGGTEVSVTGVAEAALASFVMNQPSQPEDEGGCWEGLGAVLEAVSARICAGSSSPVPGLSCPPIDAACALSGSCVAVFPKAACELSAGVCVFALAVVFPFEVTAPFSEILGSTLEEVDVPSKLVVSAVFLLPNLLRSARADGFVVPPKIVSRATCVDAVAFRGQDSQKLRVLRTFIFVNTRNSSTASVWAGEIEPA